jgi:hypothetical protein
MDGERKHVYIISQADYSENCDAPRKLAYMKKRGPVSEFAVKRGKAIKAFRLNCAPKLSQAGLADKLGLASREIISLYEAGWVDKIPAATLNKLISLGMAAAQLVRDGSELEMETVDMPTVSAAGRRIAFMWDKMPKELQDYMIEHIDSWEKFNKRSPLLASIFFREAADPKRRIVHEKMMEQFTERLIEKNGGK